MALALAEPAAGEAPGIVRLSDIRFAWPGKGAFSLAVKDFALPARQRILLIGPSGSGKSTFLSLLCGILAPQSGRIEILGQDLTKLGAAARDACRAEHFGIIFQMFNLLPYGSVIDNVLLPLELRPRPAPARHGRRLPQPRRPGACWPGSAWSRACCAATRRPT